MLKTKYKYIEFVRRTLDIADFIGQLMRERK
jgi:hypothetical protein